MIPESEWKFLEGTEQRIKHLTRRIEENRYALFTGRPLPWDPEELAAHRAALVQEMDYAARVEQALHADPTPEEAQHLRLHRRWVIRSLFETHPEIEPLLRELRGILAAFRPRLADREASWADLRHVLLTSEDRTLREAAWKAPAPLGERLHDGVTELVRLRETLARTVVDSGFPEVAFSMWGQERTAVVARVDEFERITRDTHAQAKHEVAEVLGVHEAEPWDMAYGLMRLSPLPPDAFPADRAAAAAAEQLRRWGFDPDTLPVRLEEADLPWPSLRVAVELPGDVRFLLRPAEGFDAYRIRFHALGSGLRDTQVAARRHFLEQESPAMVEAAGMLLESVVFEPDWLARVTGAPAPAIRTHLRAQRFARIAELRRAGASTVFENLVYTPSPIDPQKLFSEINEQVLLEARNPQTLWCADAFLVDRPLYRGTYLLAAMIAAQTRRHLRTSLGDAGKEAETGRWLQEHYFAPGGRLPWEEKVERATGEPLRMDALVDELQVEFTAPMLSGPEELSDEVVEDYFKDIDLSDLEDDTEDA